MRAKITRLERIAVIIPYFLLFVVEATITFLYAINEQEDFLRGIIRPFVLNIIFFLGIFIVSTIIQALIFHKAKVPTEQATPILGLTVIKSFFSIMMGILFICRIFWRGCRMITHFGVNFARF